MSKRVRTTRRLEVWLKDTSVALFVLNIQRRLVFFNAGCESLSGWTPAEVMGQVCDFVTESDTATPAALLASLAPPMDVWQGRTTTSRMLVGRRNLDPMPCTIHFYPLTDLDQKVQAVLGIIQPGTPADDVSPGQRSHLQLAMVRHLLRKQFAEETIIGRSAAMKRLIQQVRLAQKSTFPIHFVGEVGTGCRFLARLIHQSSEFGHRAFVPLDCENLPADHLAETFSRLTQARLDEALQPGTIYLDRVETLPRDLQQLVLKLIESDPPTGIRVMTASTRSIETLVASDEFLPDLATALTSLVLTPPPLRNRTDDLEPLAQYFLEELNRGDAKQVNGFHDDVWLAFRRYNWPGNVRELRSVVKEARKSCTGPMIELQDLPFGFRVGVDRQTIGPAQKRQAEPLDALLLKVEREQIELALLEAKQNKARAAEILGITRPRLYRRMEILGIADAESPMPEDSPQ